MADQNKPPMSRRDLFSLIGTVAGSAVMYEAMSSMAFAEEAGYSGPPKLSGAPKGATVLILGSGLAGMVSAYELRKAGYKVQILEYQNRPGGRNISFYGGDTYTELGGAKQNIQFDKGLYMNPGPWRIPYHHQGILHYCKTLGVALEPFIQLNYNAYVHSTKAFGGKPQRFRHIQTDFQGHVAELLSKSTRQAALDQAVTKEDQEILLQALRQWGALDANYEYKAGDASSGRRGYDQDPGGGLTATPTPSTPIGLQDLLHSGMWRNVATNGYETQHSIFQPVGGMGMIGKTFGEELKDVIQYNSKVTAIKQDGKGVTVSYVDTVKGGPVMTAKADYCICTIPVSVLSQIPITVSAPMQDAINHLAYSSSVKVGLQFKRRFWEEDENIYGGITYTDQPNSTIAYPNFNFFSKGPGVILGAYAFGPSAFRYASLSPEDRIKKTLEYGAKVHPQYMTEFQTGASVAWHRVPWTLGCAGAWTEELRAKYYNDMCALDGRIMLAGEHCSRIPAWMEGAVLSASDAVRRLHQRVMAA
ncbi:MAG: rebO 1 [Caulobacteraceae bacterium]|nr:rebO 1 [Caulobacteraceae bacterium]